MLLTVRGEASINTELLVLLSITSPAGGKYTITYIKTAEHAFISTVKEHPRGAIGTLKVSKTVKHSSKNKFAIQIKQEKEQHMDRT